MTRPCLRVVGAAAAAILLYGCASGRGATSATLPVSYGEVEFSLFLIGDAGEPAKGGEPVLRALTAAMSPIAAQSAVVFLGDNIYPRGLPVPDDTEMQRRLQDQINAVPKPAAGVFVPGNHDWDRSGARGLASVQAEQALVRKHEAGNRIRQEPANGCPGPATVDDLSPRLRLVAIDTQWWLHEHHKGCTEIGWPQFLSALEDALASAGSRQVVLVSHHPMMSSGPHGSYYNWQDHLFPLTRVHKALWVPLPGIGSLYPLIRYLKRDAQDMRGEKYSEFRDKIGAVLQKHRPLVYAGGHEHTQEVLKGESARFLIVSGAGIYGHVSPTRHRQETLFREAKSGFMRIAFERGGGVRLVVYRVDAGGVAHETWWTLLSSPN